MAKSALYIASVDSFSGKTTLAVGIGRKLAAQDLKLGYLKPLSFAASVVESNAIDEDAALFRAVFALEEPESLLSPVLLTQDRISAILCHGDTTDYRPPIESAYRQASSNKDLMLIEGGSDWQEGALIDLPAAEIASLLNARVLLTIRWKDGLTTTDEILAARDGLGTRLLGCVINAVPDHELDYVLTCIKGFVERKGVKVLAVLPEDRVLLAVSVNQIAEHLDGEFVCCTEQGEQLVQNLLVGAMNADSALDYFCRIGNKAVITGGDRADIQLAALETATKALILTGNLRPHQIVVNRADELGIPIILAKQATLEAVELVQSVFGKVRFQQQRKIDRIDAMLDEHFDFEDLEEILGLG